MEAGRNLPTLMVAIFAFCFSAAKSVLKINYPDSDFIFSLQIFNNLVAALLVYSSRQNPICFPLQNKLVTTETSILTGLPTISTVNVL